MLYMILAYRPLDPTLVSVTKDFEGLASAKAQVPKVVGAGLTIFDRPPAQRCLEGDHRNPES